MFSVIFEVRPREEHFEEYLGQAKRLRPILETVDGFIDNERFESRARPGWVLSHSTWRDEKSVVRWRTDAEHHEVQQLGREEILADYHLRVGDVTSDSDGPVHEQRYVPGKLALLASWADAATAGGWRASTTPTSPAARPGTRCPRPDRAPVFRQPSVSSSSASK